MNEKDCMYCSKTLIRKGKNETTWKNKKFCNRTCKERYRHKNNTASKELRKEQQRIRNYSRKYFKDQLADCCELCRSKENLEIHHDNYIALTKENCHIYCRVCHRKIIHNM